MNISYFTYRLLSTWETNLLSLVIFLIQHIYASHYALQKMRTYTTLFLNAIPVGIWKIFNLSPGVPVYIYIRYKPYINLACFNAIKILSGIFINQVLFTENNLSNEHKMQTWTRDVAYYLQVTEYNIMFAYILPFFVWRAAQQIVLCLKRIDVWRLYSRLSH